VAFGDLVQSAENTSTSATTNTPLPGSPTAGNLIVLRFAADDYNGSPNSPFIQPTGGEQQTYHGGYLWYHISDGTNSYQYTIGSASPSVWIIEEYEGPFDSTTPLSVSNGTLSTGGGTSLATPSVVPPVGDHLAVAMFGASSGSSLAARTATFSDGFVTGRDIGASTGGTKDFVASGSRVITGNGSTGFSTTGTMSAGFAPDSLSAIIALFKKGVAGAAYEIDADGGTYALTGVSANLERGRIVAANSGSYSLVGTASNIERGYEIAAVTGAYTLSGSNAALERGFRIAATGVSYTLTGTGADLIHEGTGGYTLAAEVGIYTLFGSTAGLVHDRMLTGGAGAYALSGQTTGLMRNRIVSANSGSYSLIGFDAGLTHAVAGEYALVAEAGAYALIGTPSALEHGYELAASSGSYSLSGSLVSLERGYEIVGNSGSYTILGQSALLEMGCRLDAVGGNYVLAGSAVDLVLGAADGVTLLAATGAYLLVGIDAELVRAVRVLNAQGGAYELNGMEATLSMLASVTPDSRVSLLTGSDRIMGVNSYPRTSRA